MDGKLPNYSRNIPLICSFYQTVGKPYQRLILTKIGYLSQISLLLVWNQPILKKVGKATELRKRLSFAHRLHRLDRPVIPGAGVARMTGVIVASIRRIRFKP
jgi:hypothetical protein